MRTERLAGPGPTQIECLQHHYHYWREKWGFDLLNPDMDDVLARYGGTEVCWRYDDAMRADGERIAASHAPDMQASPTPMGLRNLAEAHEAVPALRGPLPSLSILMVTWNESAMVERSLPPLLAQLRDGDELIVADNDSTDDTAALVRAARAAGAPSCGCPRIAASARAATPRPPRRRRPAALAQPRRHRRPRLLRRHPPPGIEGHGWDAGWVS